MQLGGIVLTLTERCNFRCAHCYGDYGPKGADMDLNHALNCIEMAARQRVEAVHLTGGEPTLYPGLLPCIEKAAWLGLRTVLSTNGSFKAERLGDMRRAGLCEVHVSYDKFHAPYISVNRVKKVIDMVLGNGMTPVLTIIEANSYAKYQAQLGDYYRYCLPGHTFAPLVMGGRAVHLPRSEFESDTPLLVQKAHQFGIFVFPDGRVSFCPSNHYFASTVVDLATDWLDGIVDTFSRDPTVQTLVNEGVSGLLRRHTGKAQEDWASTFYECNLCLQITAGGELVCKSQGGMNG